MCIILTLNLTVKIDHWMNIQIKHEHSFLTHKSQILFKISIKITQIFKFYVIPDGGGGAVAVALGAARMTKWIVSPSFTLCCFKLSPSFIIFPAKMRHNWSGSAGNFFLIISLNWNQNKSFNLK